MSYLDKLSQLRDGTLPADQFSHRDHIGVAAAALIETDFSTAHNWIADGIQSLAKRAGAADKFSATITFFYLSEIAERVAEQRPQDAEEFLRDNPDLLAPEFLTTRFSAARLASPLSRALPLMPDRIQA